MVKIAKFLIFRFRRNKVNPTNPLFIYLIGFNYSAQLLILSVRWFGIIIVFYLVFYLVFFTEYTSLNVIIIFQALSTIKEVIHQSNFIK